MLFTKKRQQQEKESQRRATPATPEHTDTTPPPNPLQHAWATSIKKHLSALTGKTWAKKGKREKNTEARRRAHQELEKRLDRTVSERTLQTWRKNGTTTREEDDTKLSKYSLIDEHGSINKTAQAYGVTRYAVTEWRDNPQRTTPPWQTTPTARTATHDWTDPVTIHMTFTVLFGQETSGQFNRSTTKRLSAEEANSYGLPLDSPARPNDPDVLAALNVFLEAKYFEENENRKRHVSILSVESLEFL